MTCIIPLIVDYCKSTFCGLAKSLQNDKGSNMNEAPFSDVGRRLTRIRLGFSNMPQRDWAEKHCFSVTQYNNWERGVRRIPLENAERLCDLYGLTLDAIYRGRLDGLSENARKVF